MSVRVLVGDCRAVLRELPEASVDCVVTSPPYWGLRDYGVAGQIGLEATPYEYVEVMVEVFAEVWRVLKPEGTVWLNLGDTYHTGASGYGRQGTSGERYGRRHTQPNLKSGLKLEAIKPKDLVMIPARVAIALQEWGWWVRQEIVWAKPNPMPESVEDRCTRSHEALFMLSKNGNNPILWRARDTREWSRSPDLAERIQVVERGELVDRPRWRGFDYYFDADAILEPAVTADEAKYAGDENGLHSARSYAGTGKSTRRFRGTTGTPHGRHALGEEIPLEERRKDLPENQAKLGAYRDAQRASAKQDGVGKPNYKGFNDRYFSKEAPVERNKRDVWHEMEDEFAQFLAWKASQGCAPDVWNIVTTKFKEAHFATFPPALVEPCLLAGCPKGGVALDIFGGAGTTGLVADRLGLDAIVVELKGEYAQMARDRITGDAPLFAEVR